MKNRIDVGIIGDYDPQKTSHPPTNSALKHAADHLGVKVTIDWLPTPTFLEELNLKKLAKYDCLWASSGSPFQSTPGILRAIQRARELSKPFVST